LKNNNPELIVCGIVVLVNLPLHVSKVILHNFNRHRGFDNISDKPLAMLCYTRGARHNNKSSRLAKKKKS